MVEYTPSTDNMFAALADPVRRDIMLRAFESEMNVSEIAVEYDMSLAAVSKHLKVLREANLIRRRKQGRYQMVRSNPQALQELIDYIEQFVEPTAPQTRYSET